MCGFLHSLNNPGHKNSDNERGAILIMVLFIVALVAGLGIKFASQYQLGLARAESRWHGLQARAFLAGTEEVAKLVFETADLDPEIDYLGEPWANEVPIEEDGVTGVAKLVDATSKLNLNDLNTPFIAEKQPGDYARYSEPQRRFIRLLQTLSIEQQQAEAMLEAVVDWIDGDDTESGMGGAEATYYQGQPDPYSAPNALFSTIYELRLIRGFAESPELVLQLMPFITVLPTNQAGINVNTLAVGDDGQPANNLVRSFNTENDLAPISDTDAQQFLNSRPETGFADFAAISEAWGKLFSGRPLDGSMLNVKTQYFWLEAEVQLVDQRRSIRSLLVADAERKLSVIQRDDVYEWPTVVRPKEED